MWVHPNEMLHAEESVSTASWLPRMADFEAYGRCFDDGSGNTSVPQSPMEDCCINEHYTTCLGR